MPTSATGTADLPGAAGAAARRRPAQGFTLIELVVALSVAALFVGLVPSAMGRAYEAMEYRSTVRYMMTDLRAARLSAMRSGRAEVFLLDVETRRFGVGPAPKRTIPEGVDVRFELAEGEALQNGGGVRFYPDGSATGGEIDLRRASGEGVRISVDWLLGRVRQRPLGA